MQLPEEWIRFPCLAAIYTESWKKRSTLFCLVFFCFSSGFFGFINLPMWTLQMTLFLLKNWICVIGYNILCTREISMFTPYRKTQSTQQVWSVQIFVKSSITLNSIWLSQFFSCRIGRHTLKYRKLRIICQSDQSIYLPGRWHQSPIKLIF